MRKFFCVAVALCLSPLLFAEKHFETEGGETCFYYYMGDMYSDSASYVLDFDSFYSAMDRHAKEKDYEFIFVRFAIGEGGLTSLLRSTSGEDSFEYRDKDGSRAILSFLTPSDEGYKVFYATEKNAYATAKETFKIFAGYADSEKKRIASTEKFASEMELVAKCFAYNNIVVKKMKSESFGQQGQYCLMHEICVADNAITFSISCSYKDIATVSMTFTDNKENTVAKSAGTIFARNYGTNFNEAKRDFKTQSVF